MNTYRKEENKVKNKKNKVFLISLAIVLAVSLGLVGCTGDGGPTVITLDFYTMYPPDYLYIADFYRHWHDVGGDEVLRYLTHWRMRHLDELKPPQGK